MSDEKIIQLYVKHIISGNKNFSEVPDSIKEEVKTKLIKKKASKDLYS